VCIEEEWEFGKEEGRVCRWERERERERREVKRERRDRGIGDFESFLLFEVVEKLAAGAVLGDHVQLLGRLEGVDERHDELVADGGHDAPLRHGVLRLVAPLHVRFLHHLAKKRIEENRDIWRQRVCDNV